MRSKTIKLPHFPILSAPRLIRIEWVRGGPIFFAYCERTEDKIGEPPETDKKLEFGRGRCAGGSGSQPPFSHDEGVLGVSDSTDNQYPKRISLTKAALKKRRVKTAELDGAQFILMASYD